VISEQPLVLVVEDEPKMHRLLQIALAGNGMRYVGAVTMWEGLSKTESERPDVVLADLGLPAGDGIEV